MFFKIFSFFTFRAVNMSDHFSMKRENLEMEEISMRHVEIKKEPQDLNNVSELRDPNLDNSENLKEEASYPKNQISKSGYFSNTGYLILKLIL